MVGRKDRNSMGRNPTKRCLGYLLSALALAWVLGSCSSSGGGGGQATGITLLAATPNPSVQAPGSVDVAILVQGAVPELVSLAVLHSPSGISGSFSPAETVANSTSTLRLDVLAEVAVGTYPIKIVGIAPSGNATLDLLLSVGQGAPPPPPPPPPPPGTTHTISGMVSLPAGITSLPIAGVGESVNAARGEGLPAYDALRDRAPFVPGEIIVKFSGSVSTQAQATLHVAGAVLHAVRPLAVTNATLYRVDPAHDLLELIAQLNARADVVYAQPNHYVSLRRTPNDTFYAEQWHYPAIELPRAWDITTGSSSVVMAVVDTGILFDAQAMSRSHPDLKPERIVGGYDFISDPASAGDGDGRDPNPFEEGDGSVTSFHGSHVAGTMAAWSDNGRGVAGVDWNAKLLNIRVLGVNGSGNHLDVYEGMMWAAGISVPGIPPNAHPAQVINMSLGGEGPCKPFQQDAIDQARARGAIIVVAAGNENDDASRYNPNNCNGVINVGATDPLGARAPYSNYGPSLHLMAPGGNLAAGSQNGVLSLGRTPDGAFAYTWLHGTSMAAPHVAGVIALMKAVKPSLSASEALSVLQQTARPLTDLACHSSGPSEIGRTLTRIDCGAGLIDAHAALQVLGSSAPDLTSVRVSACASPQQDCREGRVDASGAYVIEGLTPGHYVVEAWLDTNGNAQLDAGDYYGCFGQSGQQCAAVATPAQGIHIQLQRLGGGGGGGNEVSISGTVFAPSGGDVAGSFVKACPVVGSEAQCGASGTVQLQIAQGGSSASYTLNGLAERSYAVIATKDVNGDGKNDYFGCYGTAQGCTTVTPPAQGIDVMMQLVGGGGGGGTTVSGTVRAPPSGDVEGTFVLACRQVQGGSECTGRVIAQSGSNASYTLTDLDPNTSYTIEAHKDVNGNGTIDAGDYVGCWGGENCTPVTPPAENIDVQLRVVEGGGGGGGDGVTIAGTLYAPPGGNVARSIVFACLPAYCPPEAAIVIDRNGESAPYSIGGLEAGRRYLIFAYKDVNRDGFLWEGDYFGCYGGVNCLEAVAPATGIDVRMEVIVVGP